MFLLPRPVRPSAPPDLLPDPYPAALHPHRRRGYVSIPAAGGLRGGPFPDHRPPTGSRVNASSPDSALERLRALPFGETLFGPDPIEAVQELFGLGRAGLFEAASALGDTWGLMLVLGLGLWIWGLRVAYPLFAIIALGAVTKELFNVLLTVPRPEAPGIVVYQHLATPAFPSGHVYEAVGPWALLYRYGRVPLLAPLGVALLVSVGRLYLAAHYLGDVLAALLLAVLLVLVFPALWRRAEPWLRRRSFSTFALAALAGTAAMAFNLYLNQENAHRWEVTGFAVGAALSLLLAGRLADGDASGAPPREGRLPTILLGTAGIAALYLLRQTLGDDARALFLLTNALGACWALLLAPALGRMRIGRG